MDKTEVLTTAIRDGDVATVSRMLQQVKTSGSTKYLSQTSLDDETILHRAVKLRASENIIHVILEFYPGMLVESRARSEWYKGQTALHIAITGGDTKIVEILLRKAKEQGVLKDLLSCNATGSRFENTVMLGELPLLVAALTLNLTMVETLRTSGASFEEQNYKGDNVIHCLIKYAHLYPEKLADIMAVVEYIAKCTLGLPRSSENSEVNKLTLRETRNIDTPVKTERYIWCTPNNAGLNPLKLAAKLGQQTIFKYIMELDGVYCFVNSEDGLFDVELYDVTDIDSTSEFKIGDLLPWADAERKVADSRESRQEVHHSQCKIPTLEMIFDSDSATVFKFIEMSPLRYVINRKWEFYRWLFAIWGVLHMLFMVGFTVYAVRRSSVPDGLINGTNPLRNMYEIGTDGFVTFFSILALILAFLYVTQEVVRTTRGHMPWTFRHVMNCYHNGPFRIVFVLFAFVTVVDFIWKLCDLNYRDYFLVCAMILGWWFLVFFLRAFRQFSFFTVMIQKVLIGDMFRFSIVIGMELIAFTSGIFIVFRGSETKIIDPSENESVHEYSKLMIAMFKMMFGFTSLDVLFQAPSPWFAICIYVAFVLLTYVLMINSLIAMMSNTCSIVSQNREVQYRVQQLSVILFFESVLPVRCLRMVGQTRDSDWYDHNKKQFVKRSRSFMEVRSLHEITKSKSRHKPNTQTMLETIFHTIKNIQFPRIGVFDDEDPDVETANHRPLNVRKSSLENVPTNMGGAQDASANRRHRKKKKKKAKEMKEEGETDGHDTSRQTADNRNDTHTVLPAVENMYFH